MLTDAGKNLRIVSLLPSATEIVCALGLKECLVGVSHECDYPPFVKSLPKVTRSLIPADASSSRIDHMVREKLGSQTSLYTLSIDTLETLKPDLIVTQALCDVCAVSQDEVRDAVCSLEGSPRVVNLEPNSLDQIFDAIHLVGKAAGVEIRAQRVIGQLRARVKTVETRTASVRYRPRVALLEWLDPPFSCGHWNPELVRLAGGVEALGVEGCPSRTLRWEEVMAFAPEVIVFACCGFGIERTLEELGVVESVPGWYDLPAVRTGRVYVADGSAYFSRPGPRIVDSLEMLAHSLHPDIHPLPPELSAPLRLEKQVFAR